MPYCDHCNEEMGYLPFKCKYCGGTFCKDHRLPENHNCTFEIKHIPSSISQRKRRKDIDEKSIKYSASNEEKKMNKFLKKEEKKKRRASKIYERHIRESPTSNVSTYLILSILILSIAAIIRDDFTLALCLSSFSFLNYYIWTFFTSSFVYYTGDFLGIFILFFFILFFYNTVRIIEMRFGGIFLLKLYLISAFFSGLLYILLWLPFYLTTPDLPILPIGLAFGGVIGIISFLIFFSMNTEMTMLIMFVPVRMKGKIMLLLIVLLVLLPGFFMIFIDLYYIVAYLPDLGGLLGSYIIFKYKFRKIR
ncbi:MAG: hypothetical protein JXA99_01550 [Candidatus Lokiarchaeota archaeon]|nr:hypothetical protein [Candidatus Lokiarchaeota archaeon]